MNQKQRLDAYEAELEHLFDAHIGGQISEDEMRDAVDDLFHPLVGKFPHDFTDEDRLTVALWHKQKGDEAMRRADEAQRKLEGSSPGISARMLDASSNPGLTSRQ